MFWNADPAGNPDWTGKPNGELGTAVLFTSSGILLRWHPQAIGIPGNWPPSSSTRTNGGSGFAIAALYGASADQRAAAARTAMREVVSRPAVPIPPAPRSPRPRMRSPIRPKMSVKTALKCGLKKAAVDNLEIVYESVQAAERT